MQTNFPFLSIMPAPKDAPDAVILRISSEVEAIRVSIRARGFKQAWYAAQLNISEAYMSQIVNGRRDVPSWFCEPFCVLAGSYLLRQYGQLQEALAAMREQSCAKRQIERLAAELRCAA